MSKMLQPLPAPPGGWRWVHQELRTASCPEEWYFECEQEDFDDADWKDEYIEALREQAAITIQSAQRARVARKSVLARKAKKVQMAASFLASAQTEANCAVKWEEEMAAKEAAEEAARSYAANPPTPSEVQAAVRAVLQLQPDEELPKVHRAVLANSPPDLIRQTELSEHGAVHEQYCDLSRELAVQSGLMHVRKVWADGDLKSFCGALVARWRMLEGVGKTHLIERQKQRLRASHQAGTVARTGLLWGYLGEGDSLAGDLTRI